MLRLATCSNARYMDKMRPYLDSLSELAGAAITLLGVDCLPPEWLAEYPYVEFVSVPRCALAGSPPETESLQHGGWLPYVPGEPDDVVIWTDGDMFCQRNLADSERAELEAWPDNRVGISYNMGPQETLLAEALFKLRPSISDGEFLERWGRITLEGICFNIGVMIARRSTFQRMYDLYMPLWDEISRQLQHQARQQWLVSYVLHTGNFDLRLLPYECHMHAHFPLPPGALVTRDGEAYYNNHLVLFWHVPMWARKEIQ